MPAKNCLKSYIENGFYHIYNRGVEKRIIFQDDQDYKVFLNYLKIYLEPPIPPEKRIAKIKETVFIAPGRPLKNFNKEIELLAYCLMPNHFHLLIKQNSPRSIESFTRALLTKYSMYFNKRYKRVGTLFQSTYKAILVMEDNYLLHLSRYIHLNPAKHLHVKDTPLHRHYSSYGDYLGKKNTHWLKPEIILSFFKQTQKKDLKDLFSYQGFVENFQESPEEILQGLIIEKF